MRLTRVILRDPIRLPGMASADTEVTEDECEGLRYDERRQVVVFGETKRERPREQVIEWEPADEQLVCPECQHECVNAQGLGAHRWRAHKVKGDTRRSAAQ